MIDKLTVNLISGGLYNVPIYSNVTQIAGNISEYSHSITALGGCESATIKLDIPINQVEKYLNLILNHIRINDQYAQQIWCGFVNRVTVDFGSATTSIGVENYASRFGLYTGNGVLSATSLYDDNVAKAYGDKFQVIRLNGTTISTVMQTALLTRHLTRYGAPTIETKTVAESRSRQVCSVTLECLGYYQITNWKCPTAAFAGTAVDIAQSIVNVMGLVLNPNAWFTIGYTLPTTGNLNAATNTWDAYTSYNQILNDLYEVGTSTGQTLMYGVFGDGQYVLDIAQINYQTIHYIKNLGSSKIYSTAGNEIPPTQVVPDRNLSIQDLKPLYSTYAQTYPGLQYINRVSLQINRSGYQLNLEPADLYDAGLELALLVKANKFKHSNN
jgi:hypothetical protein